MESPHKKKKKEFHNQHGIPLHIDNDIIYYICLDMLKIIVGGTFSVIHKGYEKLFEKAFGMGEVTIGLTSDEFIKSRKQYEIIPYEKREKNLREFLKKFPSRYEIKKIEDRYGFALERKFDAIVVSEETYETALEINNIRIKSGLKPLVIEKIDMQLAEDLKPISSTRIINKKIDKNGKLLS